MNINHLIIYFSHIQPKGAVEIAFCCGYNKKINNIH